MSAEPSFEDVDPLGPGEGDPALHVDVDGFEGPLDLLLELARRQKVDLHRISILALAERYLAFVEEARRLRLELAADYLVMAAWLAFLKSRLLLPEPPKGEEPSAADLAMALALRLQRLESIRAAARHLADRDQLGRDVFTRGAPEPIEPRTRPLWDASLYDLLTAYARQRVQRADTRLELPRRQVWSIAEARAALERLIGPIDGWAALDLYLARYVAEPAMRPSVLASSLCASLEMVREGRLSIRQDAMFAPVWIRAAPSAERGRDGR